MVVLVVIVIEIVTVIVVVIVVIVKVAVAVVVIEGVIVVSSVYRHSSECVYTNIRRPLLRMHGS